jgi:Glycoside hydrolase family 44
MRKHIGRCDFHLECLEDRWAPAVVVNIDATANIHAIDPRIYGVAFATTAQLADLNSPSNRWGGNTTSSYNWQANADNRGNDWYFQSLPYGSATPGQEVADFITSTKSGQADPLITIPTNGWVAKLGPNRGRLASYSIAKYGPQTGNDWQWFPDAGNGILSNGNVLITNNDPTDANVAVNESFQTGWVNLLKSQIGGAANARHTYILDNEPSIWYSTHRDTHPNGASMQEISDRMRTYSAAIKSADANSYVMGPEEYGWSGYFLSGKDQQYGAETGDWSNLPDKKAHNGADYLPWVLQDLKTHDLANGARTLDAFTLHIYPQGDLTGHDEFSNNTDNTTQLLRNRSTRELWDPSYVDQSWISQAGPESGIVKLIPRMRQWVDTNYFSGTDIGITEYNWGAEGHMNGATAQADIYGIFGRENLNLANRWTTPATNSPAYLAMKMYRNYDGLNDGFGDVSSQATVPNPDQVSTFVSRRSSDGALTVVVINKNLYSSSSPTTAVTVNLSHFANTGSAQFWQLAATNPNDQTVASITHQANVSVSGSSFTFNAKDQSVNMFVIMPAAQPAPTVAATVDDGTAQRSRVASLTLTFSELVSLGSGAISLTRTGPGGTTGSVPVTIDTSASTATQTIAKLTFGGAFFSGGSLIDGRYALSVKGNLTLDASGSAMASDFTLNFHRFFGDIDGDGAVGVNDFVSFRQSFNSVNDVFDFDGDGFVSANDFLQFKNRFNSSI